MVDEGQLALVVGEADAKESPRVPRIDFCLGFLESDERLDRLFNPKDMAARRAHQHLLWCGDKIVVQYFTVRIQDRLVDHLGLQVATFEPGLAMRTLEVIRVVFEHLLSCLTYDFGR